jgi:hypothetical protein
LNPENPDSDNPDTATGFSHTLAEKWETASRRQEVSMFSEHQVIALTCSIPLENLFAVPCDSLLHKANNPQKGLLPGDVGTIIHIYPREEAFVVDFQEPDGYTVAIADVLPSQMRPATQEDLDNDRFWKKESV